MKRPHVTQLMESSHVTGEESFLAFLGEDHHKEPLRVAQPQTEQVYLGEAAIQVDLGFSLVHLGLPRVMVQGDHYLSPRPDFPDVLSDGGLSTLKAELRHQTIVDAVGSVALLGRPVLG